MNVTKLMKFPSDLPASEIGWKAYNLGMCFKNRPQNINVKIPKGEIIPTGFSNAILGEIIKSIRKKVLREILSSRIIFNGILKEYEESINTVDDLFNIVGEEKLIKNISKYLQDRENRIGQRLSEELISVLANENIINSDDIIKDIAQKLSNVPTLNEKLNRIRDLRCRAVYFRSSTYTKRYKDWWDTHRGAFKSIPCSTAQSNEIIAQKIAEVYLSLFNRDSFEVLLSDIDTFGFAILVQMMEDVDVSGIITSKHEKDKIKFTFTTLEGFGVAINNPLECKDIKWDYDGYYQKSTKNKLNLETQEHVWYWDGIEINSGGIRPEIKASNQNSKIIFDWNGNDWIVIRLDRAGQTKLSPKQLTTLYNLAKHYFNMWRTLKKQEVEIKIEFVFIRNIPDEVQVVQSDAVEV